ncbi:MAG: hypothetical protein NVS1B13_10980 [Flavisolibacter sp.]
MASGIKDFMMRSRMLAMLIGGLVSQIILKNRGKLRRAVNLSFSDSLSVLGVFLGGFPKREVNRDMKKYKHLNQQNV